MKCFGRKNINLYKKYTENPQATAIVRRRILMIIPAIVIFTTTAVFSGVLIYQRSGLRDEIDRLNASNTSAEHSAQRDKLFADTMKLEYFISTSSKIDDIFKDMNTCPQIDSDYFKKLETAAGGIIEYDIPNYDISAKAITIKATANNRYDISPYIKRLKTTGLFSAVNIKGYTYTWETKKYNFEVICSFSDFNLLTREQPQTETQSSPAIDPADATKLPD